VIGAHEASLAYLGRVYNMEEAMKVTDPVCRMEFRPEKAVTTLDHGGRTFYFCTEACRKQFEEEPEKYMRAKSD
jgi:YHS domain-containing protein